MSKEPGRVVVDVSPGDVDANVGVEVRLSTDDRNAATFNALFCTMICTSFLFLIFRSLTWSYRL